jgi:hypothetical protein
MCNALTLALHSTNKRITKDSLSAAKTNSFIPILSSDSIICPSPASPVDINSTVSLCCHSAATQMNPQIGNHHQCNDNGYITGMIKVTNGTILKNIEYTKKFSNKAIVIISLIFHLMRTHYIHFKKH